MMLLCTDTEKHGVFNFIYEEAGGFKPINLVQILESVLLPFNVQSILVQFMLLWKEILPHNATCIEVELCSFSEIAPLQIIAFIYYVAEHYIDSK